MPLLHTWSLAVEEQFYLLFPLGLLLFYRLKPLSIPLFVIALCVISFVMARWFIQQDPVGTYYLLHTRAWELAVGALVALYCQSRFTMPNSLTMPLSVVGLGMLVYAIVMLDETTPFPGYWTLLPVLGTALVIAFSTGTSVITKALSWKPFVAIGLMSYSAYLWHQPVFAFTRIRFQAELPIELYIVLIGIVLALSYVTWRYIEQPFRDRKRWSRKQIFVSALLITLSLVVIGKVFRMTEGLPSRFPNNVQQVLQWGKHDELRTAECRQQRKNAESEAHGCLYGEHYAQRVALVGDSHALTLARPLAEQFNQHSYAFSEHTQSGCAPILGYGRKHCDAFNQALFMHLEQQSSIEAVIVSALWPLHFENTRFDNEEGGVSQGKAIQLAMYRGVNDEERIQRLGEDLQLSVQQLIDAGKKVIIVYPIPEVGWHVPNTLAGEELFGTTESEPLSTSYPVFRKRTSRVVEQLDVLAAHPQVLAVKPETFFCDSFIHNRCIAELENKPLYFDDNHLNAFDAKYVAEMIFAEMQHAGWI
jgi:hypothetical protein